MCCSPCCHLAILEKTVIGGVGLSPTRQGFFFYRLEHSPIYLFICLAQKGLLWRMVGHTVQHSSRGVGVGFVENRTLEVDLEEQEGTFYGDEIKTRLGGGQEGCSSRWSQCVESHWDGENLACLLI